MAASALSRQQVHFEMLSVEKSQPFKCGLLFTDFCGVCRSKILRSDPVITGRVSQEIRLAGGHVVLAGGHSRAAAQSQDELLTVLQCAFVAELL